MNEAVTTKTPWHLWVAGVLGLLWNGMGVTDFVMTQTKNEAWMGNFSEAQLEFFYGLPTWVIACWAVAVFGGLIGMLLILFRSKMAILFFAASMVGFLGTAIQNYGMSNGMEVMGAGGAIFTGVIFAVAVFFVVYAIRMTKAGVLK